MTQHYEVLLARGREIVGGPVGPNYHLVLRPVPAEGAA